ncbi:hypothetical protein HS088_TW15G00289 [Tripterygium wilfordii]|uniref:Uncharacterized protein n=1 Tax=Tripterygium wilfordii TaxID=458696 RepID=A0A7J7CLG1_TRIWF|nr:hypothetical protein HS088_TW15G00289 [Tripterygium wilfordii]
MSATMNFSSQFTHQIRCTTKSIITPRLHSSPLRKSCLVVQNDMKAAEQHGISAKRHPHNDLAYKHKRSFSVSSISDDSCFRWNPMNPCSPSDTIDQFYMLINEKNVNELQCYIAEDCLFEECSFPEPMLGKKVYLLDFRPPICLGGSSNNEFHRRSCGSSNNLQAAWAITSSFVSKIFAKMVNIQLLLVGT